MPIDASIALGVKPIQFESPINQMAKMYEMQNMQQSNQLNQMKMSDLQRAAAKEENLNALVGGFTPDMNDTDKYNALLRGGHFAEAKAFNESAAKANADKRAAESAQLDNVLKEHTVLGKYLDSVIATPTRANAISMVTKANAVLKHDPTEDITDLNAIPDTPEAVRQWAITHKGALDMLKTTTKYEDVGGYKQPITTDYFGKETFGKGLVKTQTPDSVASGKIQMRGQDLTNARELQRINQGDRRDVVASTLTDSAGNVTQYNKFGELLGTKPNAGKPSATFEKTKAAKQQMNLDLDLAIKELTDATKPGGLIETATGSGAGALRDIGAGFFGSTTEGAEALGALQPIYDKVLKMVPRFEGPQSDKDTISYNKAAGDLGNPNAPTGKKLAAAKTILRLMKDRKAQFLTRDMAEGGTIDTGATSIAPPAGFVPD